MQAAPLCERAVNVALTRHSYVYTHKHMQGSEVGVFFCDTHTFCWPVIVRLFKKPRSFPGSDVLWACLLE